MRCSTRGGRPADPARRGPPADRPLRAREAAAAASRRSTRTNSSPRSRAGSSGGRRRPSGGRARHRGRTGCECDGDRAPARAGARQPRRQRASATAAGACGSRRCTVDGVVELHVEDEGSGFPPEFLETRSSASRDRTRRAAGGGAGLGLAIVRTIAEAHGGSAHAANRERGGADVWLVLPAG